MERCSSVGSRSMGCRKYAAVAGGHGPPPCANIRSLSATPPVATILHADLDVLRVGRAADDPRLRSGRSSWESSWPRATKPRVRGVRLDGWSQARSCACAVVVSPHVGVLRANNAVFEVFARQRRSSRASRSTSLPRRRQAPRVRHRGQSARSCGAMSSTGSGCASRSGAPAPSSSPRSRPAWPSRQPLIVPPAHELEFLTRSRSMPLGRGPPPRPKLSSAASPRSVSRRPRRGTVVAVLGPASGRHLHSRRTTVTAARATRARRRSMGATCAGRGRRPRRNRGHARRAARRRGRRLDRRGSSGTRPCSGSASTTSPGSALVDARAPHRRHRPLRRALALLADAPDDRRGHPRQAAVTNLTDAGAVQLRLPFDGNRHRHRPRSTPCDRFGGASIGAPPRPIPEQSMPVLPDEPVTASRLAE